MQVRKAQQVQQQQQEEASLIQVAKYWATMINNAKTIHDIMVIQQWVNAMERSILQAHNLENVVGPLNPPQHGEAYDSKDEGTTIKIRSAPMFGLDDDNPEDVQQPPLSNDFIIVLDDEESSGS